MHPAVPFLQLDRTGQLEDGAMAPQSWQVRDAHEHYKWPSQHSIIIL